MIVCLTDWPKKGFGIQNETQKIADVIDPLTLRSLPLLGNSNVIGRTADNDADYHLFHRCVRFVLVGNVLVGIESDVDITYFNDNCMKGLEKLSELEVEELAATREENMDAPKMQLPLRILLSSWLCLYDIGPVFSYTKGSQLSNRRCQSLDTSCEC